MARKTTPNPKLLTPAEAQAERQKFEERNDYVPPLDDRDDRDR